MRICAIILDYRGASKTEACLRALIGQGIETAIVIDNGEDTAASDSLRQAIEEVRHSHAEFLISIIHSSLNLGFSKGVNLALQADCVTAEPHDAYLLINNDAQATPDMIRHLGIALKSGVDLAAPTIISDSGQRQGIMWYNRYLGIQSNRWIPFSFPFISGCCLMFRHDLLNEGRLFDESFFMYGEDVCLGWRLHLAGKMTCCLENATVQHATRGSSTQGRFFYEYHMARAHLLLALKTWRHLTEIPLMLAVKIPVLICRALIRSVRYRSLVPLTALLLGLFPLAIRKP